jgi:hypothetical protein
MMFRLKSENEDFMERLETVVDTHTIRIYDWAVIPERMAFDDRILGSGEFVTQVLLEVEEREAQTRRLKRSGVTIEDVISAVAERYNLEHEELVSGSRRHIISEARKDVAHIAVKKLALTGAEVARHMGVSRSTQSVSAPSTGSGLRDRSVGCWTKYCLHMPDRGKRGHKRNSSGYHLKMD